jgi:LPS sulfotransferase NodH
MITIVSGLPRSGTSLMMQMLAAGGLPVLSDGERKADTDNPRGYFEWERIKQLPKEPGVVAEAEGKVVKVISQLLFSLPAGQDYRIIFMQRPLREVLKSQDKMLVRRGNYKGAGDTGKIEDAFQRHLIEINKWLAGRSDIAVLRMDYHQLLRDPQAASESIADFLAFPLNVDIMRQQVDANLYRNRTE